MGCYDVYCAICGGPLHATEIMDSPDPKPMCAYWDYSEQLLSEDMLKWLVPVHMIGRKNDPEAVAQVFQCDEYDDGGYFEVWDDSGKNKHWCYVYELTAEEGWETFHFVLHTECLTVLQNYMSSLPPYPRPIGIKEVYEGLLFWQNNEQSSRAMPLTHRYYGASQFCGQDWEAQKGWEFLVANPVDVPGMTTYILSHLHKLPTPEPNLPNTNNQHATFSNQTRESSRSLEILPVETLAQVSSLLHIADVHALRLTSRELAVRVPLDQTFYRERLVSGQLCGLWDFDRTALENSSLGLEGRDWKRLVRTLAEYENFEGAEGGKEESQWGEMHDAPLGLKNRMRIWKVLGQIKIERPVD